MRAGSLQCLAPDAVEIIIQLHINVVRTGPSPHGMRAGSLAPDTSEKYRININSIARTRDRTKLIWNEGGISSTSCSRCCWNIQASYQHSEDRTEPTQNEGSISTASCYKHCWNIQASYQHSEDRTNSTQNEGWVSSMFSSRHCWNIQAWSQHSVETVGFEQIKLYSSLDFC